MSKKKNKKQKNAAINVQENFEILIQIEEYMQENSISDFSDLSVLLRLEHEEWYMAFVQNYAYFRDLITAQQKKNFRENVLSDESDETENAVAEQEETIAIGNSYFSLNTPLGRQNYTEMLSALLAVYPFKRTYAEKENLFFIIENAGTIVAVCTDKGKAMQTAEGLHLRNQDMFYDVCWYGKDGINFEHYRAMK